MIYVIEACPKVTPRIAAEVPTPTCKYRNCDSVFAQFRGRIVFRARSVEIVHPVQSVAKLDAPHMLIWLQCRLFNADCFHDLLPTLRYCHIVMHDSTATSFGVHRSATHRQQFVPRRVV